jgi:hypothetical protein
LNYRRTSQQSPGFFGICQYPDQGRQDAAREPGPACLRRRRGPLLDPCRRRRLGSARSRPPIASTPVKHRGQFMRSRRMTAITTNRKSLVSPAGSLPSARGRQFSISECGYGKLAKKKISCHPYTQKISHRSDDWFPDTTTVSSHVVKRTLARVDFAGCGETALNVSEKCEGCLKLVAQDRGGLVIDHGMLKFLCRSCIKDRN